MAEIADLVCARIQTMAEMNEPAIPTAARASVGLTGTLPTIAVSVMERRGSAIPDTMAGTASLFMCLKDIFGLVLKWKSVMARH